MGTLVRTLEGPALVADLEAAFIALAQAFLAHRGGGAADALSSDLRNLDAVIRKTEAPIDLTSARQRCPLIDTDSERPIEVFNNLGHMFVLLEAAYLLQAAGLEPSMCAPTQQSSSPPGQPIPDLSGPSWALEAYGGTDIKNNGKLAKDLRVLAEWTARGWRCFLAFRRMAWPRAESLRLDTSLPITATCSGKHGGPFKAKAAARLLGQSDSVTVVEVDGITVEIS